MNEHEFNELKKYDGGSCRDITFSKLDKTNAKYSLEWLLSHYEVKKINAIQNDKKVKINPQDFFDSDFQYMHIVAENKKEQISKIQYFISPQINNYYFLELTFFPEDISLNDNTFLNTKKWFESMHKKIPNSYYVRFENSFWIFGDVSDTSGVIFSKQ